MAEQENAPKQKLFKFPVPSEELDFDIPGFLAIMCAMLGLWLRMRVFVWQALLFSIMSFANLKTRALNFRQGFSSFSISAVGLVMAYFGPQSVYYS